MPVDPWNVCGLPIIHSTKTKLRCHNCYHERYHYYIWPSNDQIDMSVEDWRNKSIREEVCAVLTYQNKPTNQCPKCLVHYCYEHVGNHLHAVTDKEIDEQSKKDESLR